jgi:hypothetical protein
MRTLHAGEVLTGASPIVADQGKQTVKLGRLYTLHTQVAFATFFAALPNGLCKRASELSRKS